LSSEECAQLQALEQGLADYQSDKRLRDMDRVEVNMPELAETVWARIESLLPQQVVVDGSDECRRLGLPADDAILHGTWKPLGVNPYLRVARYPGDGRGHFGPHRDGAFEVSPMERSLMTLNGYLADIPHGYGGRTRFLVDDLEIYQDDATGRFTVRDPATAVTHTVRPEAGAAVIFFHGLMHDGEPLAAGAPAKWIFRFDILFRRQGPPPSEHSTVVRRLNVEAEALERVEPMVSMQLSRLALKLRDGVIPVHLALARAAALLGRDNLLDGAVDTDVWKSPAEEQDVMVGDRDDYNEAATPGVASPSTIERIVVAAPLVSFTVRALDAKSVVGLMRLCPRPIVS